ncbi:hypothetical protein BH09BAC6_BH09BAC6_12370 [soil metagenome]
MLKELFNVSEYPLLLHDTAFSKKITRLLLLYLLLFAALILVVPLILSTDWFVTHVLRYKAIFQISRELMDRFIQKMGYWKAFAYVCLVGPLLEETVFRLPLSLKKIHISLAFAVAVFLIGGFLVLAVKGILLKFLIRIGLSLITFLMCIWLVPGGLSITDNRFSKKLIVLSICLFGLMHISNYSPIQWPIIWLYPVYVLPQLCMGWAITYLRFKNGFIWGFALHVIINSVSVAFSLKH